VGHETQAERCACVMAEFLGEYECFVEDTKREHRENVVFAKPNVAVSKAPYADMGQQEQLQVADTALGAVQPGRFKLIVGSAMSILLDTCAKLSPFNLSTAVSPPSASQASTGESSNVNLTSANFTFDFLVGIDGGHSNACATAATTSCHSDVGVQEQLLVADTALGAVQPGRFKPIVGSAMSIPLDTCAKLSPFNLSTAVSPPSASQASAGESSNINLTSANFTFDLLVGIDGGHSNACATAATTSCHSDVGVQEQLLVADTTLGAVQPGRFKPIVACGYSKRTAISTVCIPQLHLHQHMQSVFPKTRTQAFRSFD
jgi:hypothetical protein